MVANQKRSRLEMRDMAMSKKSMDHEEDTTVERKVHAMRPAHLRELLKSSGHNLGKSNLIRVAACASIAKCTTHMTPQKVELITAIRCSLRAPSFTPKGASHVASVCSLPVVTARTVHIAVTMTTCDDKAGMRHQSQ